MKCRWPVRTFGLYKFVLEPPDSFVCMLKEFLFAYAIITEIT